LLKAFDAQTGICEFFSARWLIAENIKLYFLIYTKINILATRKILLIVENGFLKIILKKIASLKAKAYLINIICYHRYNPSSIC